MGFNFDAPFWQGNLTFYTFLMVEEPNKKKDFYGVVDNMYFLQSTISYWLSVGVVAQEWHVSRL